MNQSHDHHNMMTTEATTMDMHAHHNHGTGGMSNMNHGMGMNMNNSGPCDSMGMMMFFHTGKCEYILFEALRTTSDGQMVGACIAMFILGALYEGLKVFREYLLQRALTSSYTIGFHSSSSQDAIVAAGNKTVGTHMLSKSHFIQTCLHTVQVFISYCLMLVFMTYNAWLCLSIILGAGFGYFIFGWRKSIVVDINEHCH
ncbi:hypothetical protein ACJMK2_039943 [Sinanodonta woodiana]|uniref:Copper transport protein n=1 Tax=Sinanodonta woodiana TaxID=1069815 RepID=A0ABD3WDG6_SINWO